MDTNYFKKQLGQVIKDLRKVEGKTQVDLAGDIGVSQNYISEIERGRKSPHLSVLVGISESLNIPLHVIFIKAEEGGTRLYYLAKVLEEVDFKKLQKLSSKLVNELELERD